MPITERPQRTYVLGLPVDAVTMAQAVAWIADSVEQRRDAPNVEFVPAARQIVTLNPEMVVAARRDPRLRAVIRTADLVVADGVGIHWAACLLGSPVPVRVTGIDLLEAVAASATSRGPRVFLLGAAPGVAGAAARRLQENYPNFNLAGTLSGSPDANDIEGILESIAAARADIVLVAFGHSAQEQWIAAYRTRLAAAVAIGVGGALDFAAGAVQRAPRWMRRSGLEWLFRLYRQPWRLRRMMALPRFAALVLWQFIVVRLSRAPTQQERSP